MSAAVLCRITKDVVVTIDCYQWGQGRGSAMLPVGTLFYSTQGSDGLYDLVVETGPWTGCRFWLRSGRIHFRRLHALELLALEAE